MKRVYILPNLCTALNVFAGTFCILSAIEGRFLHAGIAILASCVFDFLDGILARLQRAGSRFGKEFDSLADVVSFGVAPAVLMYQFQLGASGPLKLKIGLGAVFLYVVACALRLARYNVQASNEERRWFSGLPSPGAGGVVGAYVLMATIHPWATLPLPAATAAMLGVAILMVSSVRYPSSVELRLFRKKPFVALVALAVIIVGLVAFREVAFCAIFTCYALLGPGRALYYRLVKGAASDPAAALAREARAARHGGRRRRPHRFGRFKRGKARRNQPDDAGHL